MSKTHTEKKEDVSKSDDVIELDKKGVKALRTQIELEKELAELEDTQLSLKMKKRESRVHKENMARALARESSNGIFRMYDYVDPNTCESLERELQNYSRRNPGADLTLLIRTPGGDVFSGLALHDSIRTLSDQGHHITTVGRGIVASFGGVLLQAGDTRLLGKESYLMIHELSTVTGGKLHEIRDEAEFCDKLNRRLFKILAKRTDMTADQLYKKVRATDLWLPAKAAVRTGFADEIG